MLTSKSSLKTPVTIWVYRTPLCSPNTGAAAASLPLGRQKCLQPQLTPRLLHQRRMLPPAQSAWVEAKGPNGGDDQRQDGLTTF